MKLGIIGSRFIEDKDWINAEIGKYLSGLSGEPVSLCSGGSQGVDSIVHELAKLQGIDSYMFKPHFMLDQRAEYSPRDFFTRYKQIVDNANELLVIRLKPKQEPDLEFAIEYAEKRDKKVTVIFYDVV